MNIALKILIGFAAAVLVLVGAGVIALFVIDPNQYRGVITAQIERTTGRDAAIEGDLSWDIGFPLAISVDGFRLANAEWSSRPNMVTVGEGSVAVAVLPLIKGELQVASLHLKNVDILLETGADGRNNWTFQADQAQPDDGGGGSASMPSVREVDIQDATITYHDVPSGQTLTSQIKRFDVRSDSFASPLEIALAATLAGAPVDIQGVIGPLEQLTGGGSPYPVDLQGTVLGADVQIDGQIAQPLQGEGIDLTVRAEAESLASEAEVIGLQLPPLPPFAINGQLTDTDSGYALDDLDASVGGRDLSGRIEVALGGQRPKIVGTLTSDALDVGDVFAGSAAAEGNGEGAESSPGGNGPLFPDEPLPFDALAIADADVTLKVGRLTMANGVTADDVAIDVKLSDGRLVVKQTVGGFADGSLDGEVQAGKDGSVRIDLTSTGVEAGKLLKALAITDMLQGAPLDGRVNVSGNGKSVNDIVAGLNGEVSLRLGEGGIDNEALELAGGDIATQLIGVINPFAESDKATPLKCGVVRTTIQDGIAQFNNSIGVETDKMSVVGAGVVNFKNNRIDIGFRTDALEGLGLSVAEFAAKFVRVQGTLTDPSIGVDPAGSAAGIAKLGATVGAAVATGGISLIGPAILEGAQQGGVGEACEVALGNKPEAQPGANASDAQSGAANPGSPREKNRQGGVLEGVEQNLRGLFGN